MLHHHLTLENISSMYLRVFPHPGPQLIWGGAYNRRFAMPWLDCEIPYVTSVHAVLQNVHLFGSSSASGTHSESWWSSSQCSQDKPQRWANYRSVLSKSGFILLQSLEQQHDSRNRKCPDESLAHQLWTFRQNIRTKSHDSLNTCVLTRTKSETLYDEKICSDPSCFHIRY